MADLKVQASTYGQQIPKLFGTMRVAGSVIWATDLIERRSKRGGGKGRPSTTEYSYAASFAVALSSRPIRAIRRIWADGNLLRGSSGSFQERCTFRWYDGGEDQAADPLIASAVGMESASAFRGLSYALFEELELASFGNRIPSLTFEVEADADSVDAGLIGDSLMGMTGRCAGAWPVAGYAASGDRARDALAPLFDVDGVRLVSGPGGWHLTPPPGEPLSLAGFSEARRDASPLDRCEQRRAPLSALPGTIRLRHYEPERDYQSGQQSGQVAGGGAREDRIDLPAVLPAGSARALVQKLTAAAADGRETWVVQADLAALALPVGAVIALGDGSAWRLTGRTVRGDAVLIELRRHQPAPVLALDADAGVPVGAPDWPDATSEVRVFDLPNIGGAAASAPRLVVAAAGSNDGWRGVDIWIKPGADAEPIALGTARAAAALGILTAPVASGSAELIDGIHGIEVALCNPSMLLGNVDEAALFGGANRAMLGGEMIQFGSAEAIGAAAWRLTRLLRGRGGTEATAHAAGEAFVLLDDAALLEVPDELARAAESGGAVLQWTPRAGIEVSDIALAEAGCALRPLAPVHGQTRGDGGGGVHLDWIRRGRVDTGWRDHVDLPPGESREAWRIELSPPVSGVEPWESGAPTLHIDAATIAALPPGRSAVIRQIGDFALSPPLFLPLT